MGDAFNRLEQGKQVPFYKGVDMDTQTINAAQASTVGSSKSNAASALSGEDFFKLLIAELTNQDPLEPTSNQDLLNQISSIRDIELSTSLSESLTSLTEQQRFASAGSLIGKFVTSSDSADGTESTAGLVSAVRFDSSGTALLELQDGTRLTIDQVDSILTPEGAGNALVGSFVSGFDRTDPANPKTVEGEVTSLYKDEGGNVVLELDTGESLPLANVIYSTSKNSEGAAE